MRRPYIYPHRSTRMLPLVKRRFIGSMAAAAAMTVAVWHWLDPLVLAHNRAALWLAHVAGLADVQIEQTAAFGRVVPVLLVPIGPAAGWVGYGAALLAAIVLLLVARWAPLARGLAIFVLTTIAAGAGGYWVDAAAMTVDSTFPAVWTHSEMLVWLVMPFMSALLFVTVQPSWVRGFAWMAGVELFAVVWSAARLVLLLGIAHAFGPVLLPAVWFVLGLLADVAYMTAFFSIAVHLNLRLTPERRVAWAS